MITAAGIVLAGGLGQVWDAVLSVLTVMALTLGSLAMLALALVPVLVAIGRHLKRQEPLTLVVVQKTGENGPCPWCDTHDCLDSTLCNCEAPCGSWLCVVKEASHG